VADADIVEFLARRMERSLDAARRLVGELDRETLEQGRRLTRPLAARVLDRIMQPSLI
jgi:chromosomal replication initiation ATPase DnaA